MKFKELSIKTLVSLMLIMGLSGCEDFLKTQSSTDISDTQVLADAANLNMLLQGCYKSLYFDHDRVYKGFPGYQMYVDLSGSDILCTENLAGVQSDAYKYEQQRTSASGYSSEIWNLMYNNINSLNIIIANIKDSNGDAALKETVEGQALALRGICYFNLIQFYQQTYIIAKDKKGVILRLSPDDPHGGQRASVETCYEQIVKDLTGAKSKLESFSRTEKYYVDKYVTSGILARVYLVMNKWAEAEAEAGIAYNEYSKLMSKEEYRSGFTNKDIQEVMWAVNQTDDVNFGFDPQYSFWYNYDENPDDIPPIYNYKAFFVNNKYVELFEETEDRYQFWHRSEPAWNAYWTYNKWKDNGDGNGKSRGSVPLMRGAEMLLIRAEARAQQNGKTTEALSDLQTLQNARGVKNITTTSDKTALLDAIYIERRKELLGEGVTGMLDLLRLQRPLVREGDHFDFGKRISPLPSNDYRFICQIPTREFELNKDLTSDDQNPFSGQ